MRTWRRWTEDRVATIYTSATVVVFAAVCLGPSLIGLRSLLSINALTNYFPWRAGGSDSLGRESCTGDTIDTVMPSVAYVRHEWLHGGLGAWQGLIGGGSPLGALPNLGLLDPLSLPYFVLPLWMAPAYVKLLELVVAGGGTYLFLRRLNVSRPASMLSGLVFGTSGFMVMWSNWPQTRVAALIPPLFWATERLAQRLRPADAALLAVIVASLIFGGFPAVTAWALELAAAYFVVRLVALYGRRTRELVRGVGLAVAGLVTGALVVGIQLLPFLSYYHATDVEHRASYGTLPLPTAQLITLVSPKTFGLCVAGEPPYDRSSPIETVAFIGAAALVLAVLGACLRYRSLGRRGDAAANPARDLGRSLTLFFAIGAVVIVIIGWTSDRVLRDLQWVPPFSGNPVGRIRSVLGFALAVLAGIGIDALLRGRSADADLPRPDAEVDEQGAGGALVRPVWRDWRRWLRPVIVVGFVGVVGVVVLLRVHTGGVQANTWAARKASLYVPALLIAATLVVIGLRLLVRRPWTRWIAIVAVPALVVGQSAFFFHTVLPGDDPDNFYPRTGAHAFLQANLGVERYDATGMVMYPSTSLYYGLRTATGHTSQGDTWTQFLKAVDPKVSLTPTFTAFSGAMTPEVVGSSRLLDRLGIRYWVFSPDVVAGVRTDPPPTEAQVPVPAGGTVSCTLPAGPLRGVVVRVASAMQPAAKNGAATVTVTVRNGSRVVSSARAVPGPLGPGTNLPIALPGEDFAAGQPTTVQIGVRGAAGPVSLAGAGPAVCGAVRPQADGLKLAYADAGSVIYQRLTALDRIRWSGTAQVVPDGPAALAALRTTAPGTVVLDHAAGSSTGRLAAVHVLHDSGGQIDVRVDAQGAGYLTVADSMVMPGWSATVDGKKATLLQGDTAFGTLSVPAGVHIVAFHYRAPGFASGRIVSIVGLLLLIALAVAEPVMRRRRSSPRDRGGDGGNPATAAREPAAVGTRPEEPHDGSK